MYGEFNDTCRLFSVIIFRVEIKYITFIHKNRVFYPKRLPDLVYSLVLKNILILHFITTCSYLKDVIEN